MKPKHFTSASIIALLFCITQIYAQLLDECIREANIDTEMLKRAAHNPEQNDPKFKDFLFCFNKKTGLQNPAGELQTEVIKQQYLASRMSKDFVDKIISKCVVQKSTPSETAYEFAKCVYLEKVNKTSNRT